MSEAHDTLLYARVSKQYARVSKQYARVETVLAGEITDGDLKIGDRYR
jgi:hypothetical protein